jgi:two-component system, cell cycle sensor histidine kinase and response regulator CckA
MNMSNTPPDHLTTQEQLLWQKERIESLEKENQALKKQRHEIRKLETIGCMTAGVSHEFNNMLQPVIGFSELLLKKLTTDNPQHAWVNMMHQSGQRAAVLIKHLLELSHSPLDSQQNIVDLRVMVKEVSKILQSTLPSNIRVSAYLDTDDYNNQLHLPPLLQALIQLGLDLSATLQPVGGTLELSLSMHEPHSDQPNLPNHPCLVFNVTSNKGLADQLSLSHYDWPLTVHNTPDTHEGLIARLYFPKQLPNPEPTLTTAEKPRTKLQTGLRVLLVDDEEMVRMSYQSILTELKQDVTICTNAEEALQLFHADMTPFDVILTDFSMPNMNGVELASRLHSISPKTPIFLCTGYRDIVPLEQLKQSGIIHVLNKPIDYSQVENLLHQVTNA